MKKVTSAKKNVDVMQQFKWKSLENTIRGPLGFGRDKISISLKPQKNSKGLTFLRLGIKFGMEKATQLGLVAGDRLILLYDEDDLLHFLMVKSNSGKGYKLTPASAQGDLFFNMTWKLPLKVHEIPTQILEHQVTNGHITFRIPQ